MEKLFDKKVEKGINLISAIVIIGAWLLSSFIGMSLPLTIARLNNGNIEYGIWASYFVATGLFILLIFDKIKFTKKGGKQ